MRSGSPAKESGNIFNATSRFSLVSRARYIRSIPETRLPFEDGPMSRSQTGSIAGEAK